MIRIRCERPLDSKNQCQRHLSSKILLLLVCSPARSLGFTIMGEISVYGTVFGSKH